MDDESTKIWHTLIPGVALTLHSMLEGTLNGLYGTDCDSNLLLWLRTGAFIISWIVGLLTMRWKFKRGRNWRHGVINVIVVTSWLFAVSAYPLACWIEKLTDNEGVGLNETQKVNLSLVQVFLVAAIQAASALEINWFKQRTREEGEQQRNDLMEEPSNIWVEWFPSLSKRLSGIFGAAWADRIPGVAITLQTTLSAAISATFAIDDGSKCQDGSQELIWRIIAFIVAFAGGVLARMNNGNDSACDFFVSLVLVLAWLVAVSEIPLSCWLDDDELVGWIRLGAATVFLGFIELVWSNPPTIH